MRSTWLMAGLTFVALIISFRYSGFTGQTAASAANLSADHFRATGDVEPANGGAADRAARPAHAVGDATARSLLNEGDGYAPRWNSAASRPAMDLPRAAAAQAADESSNNLAFEFALPPIVAAPSSTAGVELSSNAGSTIVELATPAAPAAAIVAGTLLAAPADFLQSRIATEAYPIPVWTKHLTGLRIMLDPGHGGDGDQPKFKRGPSGVREAEINLRLGLYLREFLASAGADVRLTRESDSAVSLEDRVGLANDWPADIFVSLHHNAVEDHPETNYSSVWHHADVDRNPASLDLSRYLADALHDVLRLPQVNDVPVKSDFLMYPVGFAVLRHAKMPAALCECSFYSNPQEEQRLRDPEYVLREAHGLFLGLARYAQAGLPRVKLIAPANGRIEKDDERVLILELDDGLRKRRSWGWQRRMLLSDSIVVRIEGMTAAHRLIESREGYRLQVTLPEELSNGPHQVDVQFQNMNKNSVINPRVEFEFEGGDREVG